MIQWFKSLFTRIESQTVVVERKVSAVLHLGLPIDASDPAYRAARMRQSLKYINDIREAVHDSGLSGADVEAHLQSLEDWVNGHVSIAQRDGGA